MNFNFNPERVNKKERLNVQDVFLKIISKLEKEYPNQKSFDQYIRDLIDKINSNYLEQFNPGSKLEKINFLSGITLYAHTVYYKFLISKDELDFLLGQLRGSKGEDNIVTFAVLLTLSEFDLKDSK